MDEDWEQNEEARRARKVPEVEAILSSKPMKRLYTPRLVREESFNSKTNQAVLVVEVDYPEGTALAGRKILVFIGFDTFAQVFTPLQGCVDPSFARTRFAPVAQFRPDEYGWNLARTFAEAV